MMEKRERQRTVGSFVTAVLVAATAMAVEPAAAKKPTSLTPPAHGKINVAVVITDNANLIDFAGPWEVFGSVDVPERGDGSSGSAMERDSDRYPFRLYTVGDARTPVQIEGALTAIPTYTFDDAPVPRIVVVGAQAGSPRLEEWLRKVAADPGTDVTMSVCTGAFKLAGAGLLDGKRATTHHGYYDQFAQSFPKVELVRGARYVESGPHLFTAGGLTSGFDLALHVVELYFGRAAAQRTADWLEYQGTGWREGAEAGH
jgi:transcriptional regulator GlxA family with amidase domain